MQAYLSLIVPYKIIWQRLGTISSAGTAVVDALKGRTLEVTLNIITSIVGDLNWKSSNVYTSVIAIKVCIYKLALQSYHSTRSLGSLVNISVLISLITPSLLEKHRNINTEKLKCESNFQSRRVRFKSCLDRVIRAKSSRLDGQFGPGNQSRAIRARDVE